MFAVRKIGMMVICVLLLLCQPVFADSNKLPMPIEYTAVGDDTYPPLVFINAKNKQDGYDIDFLNLIEQDNKIKFNIMLMDWNDAKRKVLIGNADILIGVSKNPEREELFDFTQPYLETKLVVFTQKSNFFIKSIDDLVNRRVGVQRGDFSEEFLRGHIPPLPIYRYSNQKEALAALASGKVDAVVGSYFAGTYLIDQNDWQDVIKVVGKPLVVNEYCLGVRKGNSELLLQLNNAIEKAKNTGKIKKLQDKWFGESYFSHALNENRRFLEILAGVVGVLLLIIAVGLLFVYSLRRKVEVATSSLRESNQQLANAYEITIRAFFSALEKRESGTAHHSLVVNSIALEIGREMNLSESELLYLTWGTLLHDIGKLAISDDILLKKGQLTEEEYNNIKRHPQIGYEILRGAEYLHEAALITLHHQERYDGKGYPSGLAGEDIPLLARICSVADAFEAMIADRPYRKGLNYQVAVEEIIRNSGSQFDPQVVAAFIKLDHSKFTKESKD